MKTLRDILSVGTILPALLVGQPGLAAMPGVETGAGGRDVRSTGAEAAVAPFRVAQAAPTEEELRKRQQGGQRPAAPQGQAPVQPRAPAPVTPPAPQVHPQRPVAPPAQMQQPQRPVAPTTVAPVQPQRPVAPAPTMTQPQRTAPVQTTPAPATMQPQRPVAPAPTMMQPQRTGPAQVPTAPAPATMQPKGGISAPIAPTVPTPPAVAAPMQPKGGVSAPVVQPTAPAPAVMAPKGGMPVPPAVTAPTVTPSTAPMPPATAPQSVPLRGPGVAPTGAAPTVAPTGAAPMVAPTGAAPMVAPTGGPAQPAGAPAFGRPAGAPQGAAPIGQPGVNAPVAGQPPVPPHVRPPMPPQGQPGPQSHSGGGISPLGAAAVGVGVGVVGGMLLGTKPAQSFGDVQSQRREVREGDAFIYSEPGRVIVRDADGLRLRHDETERFRDLGGDIRTERRGDETVQIYDRPDGVRIITVTDPDGRLVRRIRQMPDGRQVVLIDNGPYRPRDRWREERVRVAPPRFDMPSDVYIVDAGRADRRVLYDALEAPPVAPLERRYTLDEVRYNRDVRSYMRSVDVDTLTFETGSWTVDPSQYDRLATIAEAINRAIAADPREIYLVEGHTDAVGNDVDNLSLSDRRAQSVATILSRNFAVPAENLVTQGYGEQFPKVQTGDAARANRRVTVRRITPLIAGQNGN